MTSMCNQSMPESELQFLYILFFFFCFNFCSEGTRSDNTFKNIGLRKYAFNLPQVLSLPQIYRPPTGSYGKAQT